MMNIDSTHIPLAAVHSERGHEQVYEPTVESRDPEAGETSAQRRQEDGWKFNPRNILGLINPQNGVRLLALGAAAGAGYGLGRMSGGAPQDSASAAAATQPTSLRGISVGPSRTLTRQLADDLANLKQQGGTGAPQEGDELISAGQMQQAAGPVAAPKHDLQSAFFEISLPKGGPIDLGKLASRKPKTPWKWG